MASLQKLAIRGIRSFAPDEEQVSQTRPRHEREHDAYEWTDQASIMDTVVLSGCGLGLGRSCPACLVIPRPQPVSWGTGHRVLHATHDDCGAKRVGQDHDHRVPQVRVHGQAAARQPERPGEAATSTGPRRGGSILGCHPPERDADRTRSPAAWVWWCHKLPMSGG
jgi:hypothetical protein